MMDAFILLPLLLLLAVVIGSILGFVAFGRTNELRWEIARLRTRLEALEGARPTAAAAEVPTEEPIADVAPEADPQPAEPAAEAAAPAAFPPSAAAAPPPPPHGAAVPPPIPAAARERSLEETIGSRWAIWAGGLALALGGVFLVRYSIEAGLLGPAARVALGLLFAASLLGAGEWLRRSGIAEPVDEAHRAAYVPGILTAAGTVTAFAAVFAAYALYGLIDGAVAFVALGLVALATLALALVHGPGLAGLGLVACYGTPFLVSSNEPAFVALSAYLVAVTVATLAVARLRAWLWLAVTAILAAAGWSLVMSALSVFSNTNGPVVAVYTAILIALAHATFVLSIHPVDPGRVDRHDRAAVAMLSVLALPVLLHVVMFGPEGAGLALLVAYAASLVATIYGVSAVRLLVVPAAVALLLGYGVTDITFFHDYDPVTETLSAPKIANILATEEGGRFVGTGVVLGLLFAGLGLFGALGSAGRTQLAAAGSVIPLGLLVVAYLRIAEFDVSVTFGLVGLALAAYFAAATEGLIRRLDPKEFGVDGAIAAYAVAAVAALVAALAATFERGVLTLALAAVVPAIALVETRRPVRGLRPVAVVAAVLVSLRFLWDPSVVGTDLGTTPVFNWLLVGYGGPALAFGWAARRFALTRDDRFVPIFEALAVVFVTLTAVMLIHHAMNGGDLYAPVSGLAEQSLLTMSFLAVSLGMQWLAVRRPSPVFAKGTLVLGAAGLLAAAAGLLVTQNPMVSGETIDGGVFDGTLVLGYLLPALMVFAVAAVARRRPDRPDWYVNGASWLGGILAAVWITYAVRAGWHGVDFATGTIDEGELYAYSAVWLLAGIVLLVGGAIARIRAVRLVATVVLMVVVLKVFLLDTAELSGLLRSASLVGLGVVLIPLGLAYQKLMRRLA